MSNSQGEIQEQASWSPFKVYVLYLVLLCKGLGLISLVYGITVKEYIYDSLQCDSKVDVGVVYDALGVNFEVNMGVIESEALSGVEMWVI